MTAKRRALLSVSDKTGIAEFGAGLAERGFELLSTGGTAKALRNAGLGVTDVADITKFPEIMNGRIKTLHPAVHGGLLARAGVDDEVAGRHGIEFIDLLAVNLYPFERVTADEACTLETAIETIDIGGPAMLRAAAKNSDRVTVVIDHGDYASILEALDKGNLDASMRRRLAVKAFRHTARYDSAIAAYLAAHTEQPEACPATFVLGAERAAQLRYGENPHQAAALYPLPNQGHGSVARARQLQGKELSYNNLADADAAVQCVTALAGAACVIVKHANPCGVALGQNLEQAYERAYACDPTSAFGGVIAFNRPLDAAVATTIVNQQFAEVIAAPAIEAGAREALAVKANLRVLELGPAAETARPPLDIKSIEGALLVQQRDTGTLADTETRCVTSSEPTAEEMRDLEFAWIVAKFVKSNAIVYAGGQRTLGIGAGQMSRVDSARIAALKAADASLSLEGAVMASDAFFPFRDAVDTAAERGIRAIIQPGGALRDQEIIAAANEHGIAMVLTGMRHFRH